MHKKAKTKKQNKTKLMVIFRTHPVQALDKASLRPMIRKRQAQKPAHGYTALDGLSFIFSKTIQEVKFWITSTIDVSSREHRVLLKKVLLYCYPH